MQRRSRDYRLLITLWRNNVSHLFRRCSKSWACSETGQLDAKANLQLAGYDSCKRLEPFVSGANGGAVECEKNRLRSTLHGTVTDRIVLCKTEEWEL
jgi:hypothetical protein